MITPPCSFVKSHPITNVWLTRSVSKPVISILIGIEKPSTYLASLWMLLPFHSTGVSQGLVLGVKSFKQASWSTWSEGAAKAFVVYPKISVVESTKSTNAKFLLLYFIALCISIIHTRGIKGRFVSHNLLTHFWFHLRMKIKLSK